MTLLAALALLLGAVVTFAPKSNEPVYEGRSLTQWLREVDEAPLSWNGLEETNHPVRIAIRAVRAIGTNGVPTLLRLIEARDSRAKTAVLYLLDKQTVVRIRVRRAENLNRYGIKGFQLLRTNAQAAVPSLLVDSHAKDPQLRTRALLALEMLGYPGTP
jgi:hypothetical protein